MTTQQPDSHVPDALPQCEYISVVRREWAFGLFPHVRIDPVVVARHPDVLWKWFFMRRNVRQDKLEGYVVFHGVN